MKLSLNLFLIDRAWGVADVCVVPVPKDKTTSVCVEGDQICRASYKAIFTGLLCLSLLS